MAHRSDPSPIAYATASAASIATLVVDGYGLPAGSTCALVNRGFNDCYSVVTPGGERFVLRLSGHRARGPADVDAETAFLSYLASVAVPVASAVPTRTGTLFTATDLPDGRRSAVLFRYAEGRRPDLDGLDDARLQGMTLARIHDAADLYPGKVAGRFRLDLDHLLHHQVSAVLALAIEARGARHNLQALAARLTEAVACLEPDLTRTRCHGDCHGLNARIRRAEAGGEEAVFFDFDDGGYGYLAYDLAVHLWAQVSYGRRRHAVWRAFHAGYHAVRKPAPADEEAVPWFVPIRHIWLMGEYAGRTAEWGSEVLSAAWLEREVAFLLAWERDKLERRLL